MTTKSTAAAAASGADDVHDTIIPFGVLKIEHEDLTMQAKCFDLLVWLAKLIHFSRAAFSTVCALSSDPAQLDMNRHRDPHSGSLCL